MNLVYNTFEDCSTNFDNFFYKIDSSLTKNQRNFLSDFFTSLLSSTSSNFDKIALDLSKKYSNIKLDSILKRISRFLNNENYNFHQLFDKIIANTISQYKVKHEDNRVFIAFDHMFVREKFTVFMLSIKIGKQGFPIYFHSFEGKKSDKHGEAFKLKHIKSSLTHIHHLIKSIDQNIEIVFLADRWFGNLFTLFSFIDKNLKSKFVFRCKDNFKVFFQPKNESHKIWCSIHDLPSLKYHSTFFPNLQFTRKKYTFNLTICNENGHKERWFLISNLDPTRAKKFYSYRFGAIETIFKNQKSNGFYLEKTSIKHLHAFDNLYSLICLAVCFLFSSATFIAKNLPYYQNIGFRITRKNKNGKLTRMISLFQTGLRLFKLALNSKKYYKLIFNFKLYDI